MYYEIFDDMNHSVGEREYKEDEQSYMEQIMKQAFTCDANHEKVRIYEMMEPQFKNCNFADHILEVDFYVKEWELNPMGTMHGGLLVTAIDMACGLLVRFAKRSTKAATAQLSVNFLRPLYWKDCFTVKAKIEKQGSRIIFLTAEILLKETNKVVATASGTFM